MLNDFVGKSSTTHSSSSFQVILLCISSWAIRMTEPSIKECEEAVKAGSSVVYCQGVVPVRLEKLAPDIALAALSDKKIEYSQLKIQSEIAKGSLTTPEQKGTSWLINITLAGGFAVVYEALYNDETVAVKELEQEGMRDMTEFRREIWMMRYLQHPYPYLSYCVLTPYRIKVVCGIRTLFVWLDSAPLLLVSFPN